MGLGGGFAEGRGEGQRVEVKGSRSVLAADSLMT